MKPMSIGDIERKWDTAMDANGQKFDIGKLGDVIYCKFEPILYKVQYIQLAIGGMSWEWLLGLAD